MEAHAFSQNELGSFSNLNNKSSLIQLIFWNGSGNDHTREADVTISIPSLTDMKGFKDSLERQML